MDATERKTKFKDAAEILAHDVVIGASRLHNYIRDGEYSKAEALAASLQTTVRDCKWLVRRQPKASEG